MMDSCTSSTKSSTFSNYSNLDCDEVVRQVKELLNTEESFTESAIVEVIREISYHKDKKSIIVKLIMHLWNFQSPVSDYFIYGLIDVSNYMDVASSKNILCEIKKLLGETKILQKKVLEIIPILVSNIRYVDDKFTGFIDVMEINCHYDNLVLLVKVMRVMNTMTNVEKSSLIKRLLEFLGTIDLSQCPELVREILLLCDKVNFQYCIGSVINFFNNKSVRSSQLSQSSMNSDNKRMMDIQMSVLDYCNDIAKYDSDFVKEILKFCKNNNPVYSITGFMCILLLNLSGLEYSKDQILDFLRSCIISCFKDNKLILECAFIRESVNDQFDMDSLLLNAVKYCCVSNRNQISKSLLQLGFLLIKSGLPNSKIVTLKSQLKSKKDILINETSNNDFNMTTLQTVGHAGIQMLMHLFKKLPECRQLIIRNIISFVLKESHRTTVFIYLELFADLILIMPLEIESIISNFGRELLEFLCFFPQEVAIAVVHALLPLIRNSPAMRKDLLTIIMNNMLSGQVNARLICVESALILLKYLRVTLNLSEHDTNEHSILTQSSQFASTQIAMESRPLYIDNSANDDLCREILSMLDKASSLYCDTKPMIYRGLVQVIERNFHFSAQVVLFLLTKLEAVLNPVLESSSNPFLMFKIIKNENEEIKIDEPIGILISCLAESIRICKQNESQSDVLSVGASDKEFIINILQRSETLLNNILSCLSTQNIEEMKVFKKDDTSLMSIITTEQFIDIYEVLLAYFVCMGDVNKDMIKKIFEHREHAIRLLKVDSKTKKEHYYSVISLPTLVCCLRYLLVPLQKEVKTSHYNRESQVMPPPLAPSTTQKSAASRSTGTLDQSSLTLFLNEKVSAFLLNRAMSLIKKLGSANYRITSRNREEICKVLSEFVNISLDYYLGCLCADKIESLTTPQRQLMQSCASLYGGTLKKVIQYFSKTIDVFLKEISGMKEHLRSIQRQVVIITGDDVNGEISMNVFIKINKAIITRIMLLSEKRLYLDIDGLLNATLNLTIFCGLDDMKQTITYGCHKINTSLLNSLNTWLVDLLKSSKLKSLQNGRVSTQCVELTDSSICRVLMSMTLITSRMVMPDFICFIEKLASFINGKIGCYTVMPSEPFKSSFLLLTNPKDILADVLSGLSLCLDDTDWLLTKWKCGWLEIKQKKAINNSQLSNLGSTPAEIIESSLTVVIDQDRILIEQFQSVCLTTKKLIQCTISSVLRLQELVKITTRLFDQLILLTKQYIVLTKSKLGSCSTEFKKLVSLSGGDLSTQVSLFIVYIQKVESASRRLNKENIDNLEDDSDVLFEEESVKKQKKSKKESSNLNNQMGRTDKEIKLIPNLVFSLEQYQRYLIELQRLSKIDLMKYVKIINSRDFRIDMSKLQQSLDQNITVDFSDSDNDTVSEDVAVDLDDNIEVDASTTHIAQSPPNKKLRLSSPYSV